MYCYVNKNRESLSFAGDCQMYFIVTLKALPKDVYQRTALYRKRILDPFNVINIRSLHQNCVKTAGWDALKSG